MWCFVEEKLYLILVKSWCILLDKECLDVCIGENWCSVDFVGEKFV